MPSEYVKIVWWLRVGLLGAAYVTQGESGVRMDQGWQGYFFVFLNLDLINNFEHKWDHDFVIKIQVVTGESGVRMDQGLQVFSFFYFIKKVKLNTNETMML